MAFVRKSDKIDIIKTQPLDQEVKDLDTSEKIHDFAKRHHIDTDPLDVVTLAKKLEIEVIFKPLEDDVSGYLKKGRGGVWKMTINSLHHPNRQRFTVAHELAHRIYDCDDQNEFRDKIHFRDENQSPIETRANKFAADILMPETDFRRFVSEESSNISRIAEYFGVSKAAVQVRAKTLGYSGHGI